MEPEIAFGLVLRELRTAKGISQERLAFTGDLDRTFISLLERGKRQPSLTSILQIARALDIPPGEIVDAVYARITQATRNPSTRSKKGGGG